MFVQLKEGSGLDQGPCWVCRVEFSTTWLTARFHGLTLRRESGFDSNFVDVSTGERWWVSGPKRDRTDARYSARQPQVDDDVRDAYEAFLAGAALPGREHG